MKHSRKHQTKPTTIHRSQNKIPGQRSSKRTRIIKNFVLFTGGILVGLLLIGILTCVVIYAYDAKFKNKIYPGVSLAGLAVGGQTPEAVTNYWLAKNRQFSGITFTFQFEDQLATVSATQLEIGYDATLSAVQAYSIGRSGNLLTDLFHKYLAAKDGITLTPLFQWKQDIFEEKLNTLSQRINIEPQNALFEFVNGRVSAFKPASDGRELDQAATRNQFKQQLTRLATAQTAEKNYQFTLSVIPKAAAIQTDQANNFGIKELLGKGESYFRGSIAGRIHNIALSASRLSGVLVAPGEIFSFNNVVGDISAATGYKQAYVIKDGRTVLDDGGGVCQVSTTLFRAALNAGLPIVERHAHSYRVGYYEQGGWKPGFDATVYSPSYDLRIKNDTNQHILIQTRVDTNNLSAVFEIYGSGDGRKAELSPVRLWDSKPAPPDLYQDDPTLPVGTVKQVDWSNPGIKASFDYTVIRGTEVLFKKTFFSDFIPWQAVFLKGTKT